MGKRKDYGSLPLRTYEVKDASGTIHTVQGHWAFDNTNDGGGLIIRRGVENPCKGEPLTRVVLQFNANGWQYLKEV